MTLYPSGEGDGPEIHWALPARAHGARAGARLGHTQALDGIVWDGLWDHYNDFHMGNTGELVAEKYGVSREEQDAYAADSHRKAVAAQEAGAFDAEIFAVEVPQRTRRQRRWPSCARPSSARAAR